MQAVSEGEAMTRRDATASYRICRKCKQWYKIPPKEYRRVVRRKMKFRCLECGEELELSPASSLEERHKKWVKKADARGRLGGGS